MDENLEKLKKALSCNKNGILTGISELDLIDPKKWGEAFEKTLKNVVHRPPNSYIELTTFRKYVPFLLYASKLLIDEADEAWTYSARMMDDSVGRHYQRWHPDEDEMLIEWVCDGKTSMTQISLALGRTVPAIKTRLTYLVGVKRLSQQVAGRFIGEINGEQTEASIVGTVYKGDGK